METYPTYQEKDLLLKIARGDQEAFAKLFDLHYSRIFYHVLTYTKSNTVAEEIVQDVFLKVWVNRKELPDIRSFKDYLFIIARNQVVSAMRLRINKPVRNIALELADDIAISDNHSEKEIEQVLLAGIEKLPTQQKAVLTLRRTEELTYKEIAERLGISPNTVKFHMVAALNFLRNYVAANDIPVILLVLSKPYLQYCAKFILESPYP